jgi:transcription initiation factor TFIID TATA-box-binding protein
MDPYMTHPTNAQQAKDFTAAGTLSGFSGGAAGHLTPPSSEKDGLSQQANKMALPNGQSQGGNAVQQGNGVTPATPATPAATPGAGQGVSGIVPTLQ